jgi:hypothetical protein
VDITRNGVCDVAASVTATPLISSAWRTISLRGPASFVWTKRADEAWHNPNDVYYLGATLDDPIPDPVTDYVNTRLGTSAPYGLPIRRLIDQQIVQGRYAAVLAAVTAATGEDVEVIDAWLMDVWDRMFLGDEKRGWDDAYQALRSWLIVNAPPAPTMPMALRGSVV